MATAMTRTSSNPVVVDSSAALLLVLLVQACAVPRLIGVGLATRAERQNEVRNEGVFVKRALLYN